MTVDRIPIAHSVHYAARGLPDVPYQYGPGVLRTFEITLTYRNAPDSQLGRVHAYLAGRIHVDGQEVLHREPYGQHYDEGLDNWPAWLTEEARLHDPAAVPAVSADRAALRERIAKAVRTFPFDDFGMNDVSYALEDSPNTQEWVSALADAVMDVMCASGPALPGTAPTRRAALTEAADAIQAVIDVDRAYSPRRSNDRAALGAARQIVLGLIDKPRPEATA